jgi:hypothetical protein
VNHIDRMLDERSELAIKVNKLHTFTETDVFKAMSTIDQDLLRIQRYLMHEYIRVLSERINRATSHPL